VRGPIGEFDPEVVLVASADAVYRFDYQAALAAHAERRAAVTMVTAEVPREEAGRFGVVDVSDAGRVTDFAYKPDEPRGGTVTAEVFVYSTDVLLDTLAELDDRGEELRDFGHGLLPALVERGNAWALPLDGYWRDVGTPESYWQAHMDLLGSPPRLDLDDDAWPILTHAAQRPPARLEGSAIVDDSLVSPGCVVRGRVERSVLSTGVVVEEGVTVRDAVVLPGARLAADVTRAIVDVAADVTEPVDGGDEVVVAG
jgi:glucose-1-phosphate adenylyltransferase